MTGWPAELDLVGDPRGYLLLCDVIELDERLTRANAELDSPTGECPHCLCNELERKLDEARAYIESVRDEALALRRADLR